MGRRPVSWPRSHSWGSSASRTRPRLPARPRSARARRRRRRRLRRARPPRSERRAARRGPSGPVAAACRDSGSARARPPPAHRSPPKGRTVPRSTPASPPARGRLSLDFLNGLARLIRDEVANRRLEKAVGDLGECGHSRNLVDVERHQHRVEVLGAAAVVAAPEAFAEAAALVELERRVVVRKDVQLELADADRPRPLLSLAEQAVPIPRRRWRADTMRPRSATCLLAGCGSRPSEPPTIPSVGTSATNTAASS